MDIRHLQALVAVAEHGTFTAAADSLDTVQSNISAHVARLERELGASLVDRSNGTLSAEGQVVLERAYRVLAEVDALRADIAAMRAELTGTVRAGMIGTTARWLVPTLLADLSRRHPKLRLVVSDGTTTSLEPLLAAGRLDLAVLTSPIPGRDCTFEPLFVERVVLVLPEADERLAGTESIGLDELSQFELLLPAPGTSFRSELDKVLRPAGVRLARPRAELDGVRLIATLTFEGHGPALLPASAVPPHLRSRYRLVHVDGLAERQVGLVVRSRGMPSASARAVIELLRDLAARTDLPEGLRRAGAAEAN